MKTSKRLLLIILPIVLLCAGLGAAWLYGDNSELYLRNGWQYRWVEICDEPARAQETAPPPVDWHDVTFPFFPKDWNGKSVLELRGTLPLVAYERPILYLMLVSHHIECRVDGKLIYQSGEIPVPADIRFNPWFPFHLIHLPADAAGKEVYVRLHSNGARIGLGSSPRIGGLDEFLSSRALMDFFKSSSTALCLFAGFGALALGLRNRTQSYFAFAGIALCNAIIVMSGSFNRQLMISVSPQFTLLCTMTAALFWQGFWIWFLESIVVARYKKIVRQTRNLVFLIAVIGLALLTVNSNSSVLLVRLILSMLVFNVVLLCYVFRGQLQHNQEVRIYSVGAAAWAIASGADGLRIAGIIQLPLMSSALGQFIDLSCMALILIQRVQKIHLGKEQDALQILQLYAETSLLNQEITKINTGLEQTVMERTKILHETAGALQEQNARLERLERSRLNLLSNIAHDLRTPMTMIRGYVEVILDGAAKTAEQKMRATRVIHKKTLLLQNMIEDLFTLCKLEARILTMNLKVVPVEFFLQSIFSSYEADVAKENLRLCLKTSAELKEARLNMDMFRMEQVFSNLIHNAIKYTPPGGSIVLSAEMGISGREIILSLQDTGAGIAESELRQIFNRFYCFEGEIVHGTTSSSGLGLSIAREIVEMHHGRIWAENAKDGGSVFHVALPVCQE